MPAKKATKPTVVKKAAVKSTPAKKASAKKAVAAPAPEPEKPQPTLEDIAKAAYLNYRHRSEHGLPGDNDGDWLEAERILHQRH